MNNNFWHERWHKNEIGFHRKSVNHYLIAHWDVLNTSSNDCVFVPLCGKSIDLIWLAERCSSVVAIELSQKAVDDFFAENNLTPDISEGDNFRIYRALNITVLCGDFFQLEEADVEACSVIYDRASLIAFPPSMKEQYVAKLDQLFPNPHKRLLITLEYDVSVINGPPFSVPQAEVQRLFSAYKINALESIDIIGHSPHFQNKGLTSLVEHVFLLQKG